MLRLPRLGTVVVAAYCFVCGCLDAKVIETTRIQDAESLIDEKTWVLVDLDNCLFEAAQALGHANWFYDQVQERMDSGMSREEAIRACYPDWVKTQRVCKVKPLDGAFIPILQKLQSQGITVMGLTHRQPPVAEATFKQIHSLGFDFLPTAPCVEGFINPTPTPILYAQGILFVGDYNKKIDVLDPFLSIMKQPPAKIVFIDDKRKNVDELEVLAKRGIEYIGVHYRAIEEVAPIYNRQIAEFQYKFLDQIMSNEAARMLMEQGLE